MAKEQSGMTEKDKTSEKCTYRVIVKQPLSIEGGLSGSVHELSIQAVACRIVIRPAHNDPKLQREVGGSLLAIDFDRSIDADLLSEARFGYELIEDFLSAIALVTGVPIRQSSPALVARCISGKVGQNCEFLQLVQLPLNHWPKPLSADTFAVAKHLVAHWDGLESGKRLRRAARLYRDAIGNFDDASAFQEAYVGLEAMEPPLARMVGLNPGTEESKGECEHCHASYVRKKTTLVGVRAFVMGEVDPSKATEQRKVDWKNMNDLRNKLMHGLVDSEKFAKESHEGVVSAMHYLHTAICDLSHAPELSVENFRLARGGTLYVIHGRYTADSLPPLEHYVEPIEASSIRWVSHPKAGFVPEMSIKTQGIQYLELAIFKLTDSMAIATMESLGRTNYEVDGVR
jgi:hypothetical protein